MLGNRRRRHGIADAARAQRDHLDAGDARPRRSERSRPRQVVLERESPARRRHRHHARHADRYRPRHPAPVVALVAGVRLDADRHPEADRADPREDDDAGSPAGSQDARQRHARRDPGDDQVARDHEVLADQRHHHRQQDGEPGKTCEARCDPAPRSGETPPHPPGPSAPSGSPGQPERRQPEQAGEHDEHPVARRVVPDPQLLDGLLQTGDQRRPRDEAGAAVGSLMDRQRRQREAARKDHAGRRHDPPATLPDQPAQLRPDQEDGEVVGRQGQAGRGRPQPHRPAPGVRIERRREGPQPGGRERNEQGVGPGLLRIPDHQRREADQPRRHDPGPAIEQPGGGAVHQPDRQRAQHGRERPQADLADAEGPRPDPREDVVERRRRLALRNRPHHRAEAVGRVFQHAPDPLANDAGGERHVGAGKPLRQGDQVRLHAVEI